jgi:hypothetical protein
MRMYWKTPEAQSRIPQLAAGRFDATCTPSGAHASDREMSGEEFDGRLAADLARHLVSKPESYVDETDPPSLTTGETLTESDGSTIS